MTQHDCQSWWCAGFFLLLYWSTTPPEQKKQILFITSINRGVNRNDIDHSSTSAVLNILQLRTSIYSHLKERLNKYCLTLTRNIRHVPKWKYNKHMSFFVFIAITGEWRWSISTKLKWGVRVWDRIHLKRVFLITGTLHRHKDFLFWCESNSCGINLIRHWSLLW